jgi:hypothetical protein
MRHRTQNGATLQTNVESMNGDDASTKIARKEHKKITRRVTCTYSREMVKGNVASIVVYQATMLASL